MSRVPAADLFHAEMAGAQTTAPEAAKGRDRARACFTESVIVDFTSLVGGDLASVPAAALPKLPLFPEGVRRAADALAALFLPARLR